MHVHHRSSLEEMGHCVEKFRSNQGRKERVNCHSPGLIEVIIVDIETLLDHSNPSSLDFGNRISSVYMEDASGVLPDVDWNNISPRMKSFVCTILLMI